MLHVCIPHTPEFKTIFLKKKVRRIIISAKLASLVKGKYFLPVLLHVDNDPAIVSRLIESLVQRADMALAVVGIFAVRIGVVNEEP